MKIKLKEGVSASDIPRISGIHKMIASILTANSAADVEESLPQLINWGLDEYVEEVSSPKKEKETKKNKGDK